MYDMTNAVYTALYYWLVPYL